MGNDAVAPEFALPPVEQSLGMGAVAQGAKAQVVGASPTDIELGGVQGVGDGAQQVGRQYQFGPCGEQRQCLVQRAVEHDVGVDVDHILITARHEVGQGPGFDGGVELQNVVLEQKVVAIRKLEQVERQGLKLVRQGGSGCSVTIDDDAVAVGLRVLLRNTLHERAGKVQVVVGDDGDDGGDVHTVRGIRFKVCADPTADPGAATPSAGAR